MLLNLTNADAIHPGYGFLAENADFAELVQECNITFIGPSPEAISKMGTKDVARETMREAGVPIVPGSTELLKALKKRLKLPTKSDIQSLLKQLLVVAVKGFVLLRNEEELVKGINITQKEAETAFGNPGVYIEKYIEDFRHVEIQIIADNYGNMIHLR